MSDQDRPGFEPPQFHVAPENLAPMSQSPSDTTAAKSRRSRIGTGVAIAAVGLGVLGIAGTAYAASSTPSPSPTTQSPSTNGPGNGPGNGPMMGGQGGADADGDQGPGHGRMGPGKGMHGAEGMGLGMGIHGSFVTPKQGGGFQTVDMQQGTVTAVSSTSITVKSEDNFSATYDVNADTIVKAKSEGISAVQVGDSVGVIAIENGGPATAVTVIDRTQLEGSHKSWAPPAPVKPADPTASASGTA